MITGALLNLRASVRVDEEVVLAAGVRVRPGARVHLGPRSFLGPECWLGVDQLEIGAFTLVAGRVAFVGGDHRTDVAGVPLVEAGRECTSAISVGSDCWIGHGVTVLAGVTIGDAAVIAAGAVVTRDVGPGEIVAGVPAKRIAYRFAEDELARHLKALRGRSEMAKSDRVPRRRWVRAVVGCRR